MSRRLAALPAAALALALTAIPALAAPFPARIDLPDGWQPEGITAGRGTTAYVGSLANGAIAKVDVRTGAVDPDFAPGATGRVSVGLDYQDGADRLWVAGGPTSQVRVYDASTGELLQTYAFTSGFLNDVVVTKRAVYVTDSNIQQLIVIPLGNGTSVPAPSSAFTLPITGDFVYGGGFNANGIVEFGGYLIVPNSSTGQLFAIDPSTGASAELLPAGSVTAADGLELRGSNLYIIRNALGIVEVYGIRGSDLRHLRTIQGVGTDVPTTGAIVAGRLWVVNARFLANPQPTDEYWITQLPLR
jgi:outer membrane protein assembly factor BamB